MSVSRDRQVDLWREILDWDWRSCEDWFWEAERRVL
jgi:hypothetical protein